LRDLDVAQHGSATTVTAAPFSRLESEVFKLLLTFRQESVNKIA
jgi:hypothetical protein